MADQSSSVASSNSTVMPSIKSKEIGTLKRQSADIGWEYGVIVDIGNLDKVQCKLCLNTYSGGIHRLKQHIANIRGNVASCVKSTDEDKKRVLAALEAAKAMKLAKAKQKQDLRDQVCINEEYEDELDEEVTIGSKRKKSTVLLGDMDRYARQIDPENSLKSKKQQSMNDAFTKERRQRVHHYLSHWVYESGVAFNVINNTRFLEFVEAVGQFGPHYEPPSQYELREPLLKAAVEDTKSLLKRHEEEWALGGCSIMTDAWSDRKRRSIMNLCVNCKLGTTFLSSIEASGESHTGEYIFEYVDKCIEQVGPEKVVQVVTDNASNNMGAANLLKDKRPNIFWTSCAAHTLNLMLQGIGKLKQFQVVIEKAKAFTIFVYAHHQTLDLMRKATDQRDIVRPGVTRFASSYLTLQSLMDKKEKLKALVTSDVWEQCKVTQTLKGKAAYQTILSTGFWNGVSLCLKVFTPLVKVLRMVDRDQKPTMGFLYGELERAKEEIKMVYNNVKLYYLPILEIIDKKGRGRVDSSLHVAAYFLNPYYFYKQPTIQDDDNVNQAILTCVGMFFHDDFDKQYMVTSDEVLQYKTKEGKFGNPLAVRGCLENDDIYNPVGWWSTFGSQTPNLQKMAKRILGLTSSSSGCERNWSNFEGVHTKKRNRLDIKRLNNLVYVQFNSRLKNKRKKLKNDKVDVLLANDASQAQEWIVEGYVDVDDEIQPEVANNILQLEGSDNVEYRELDEEEFVSDKETDKENDEEYNFELENDYNL